MGNNNLFGTFAHGPKAPSAPLCPCIARAGRQLPVLPPWFWGPYVNVYTCTYMYMNSISQVYVYVNVYIYTYVYIRVCICTHRHIHIYVICVYVYVVCTHT